MWNDYLPATFKHYLVSEFLESKGVCRLVLDCDTTVKRSRLSAAASGRLGHNATRAGHTWRKESTRANGREGGHRCHGNQASACAPHELWEWSVPLRVPAPHHVLTVSQIPHLSLSAQFGGQMSLQPGNMHWNAAVFYKPMNWMSADMLRNASRENLNYQTVYLL